MEQQNCQEDTTNSENPLKGGSKPARSEDLSREIEGEPGLNRQKQKMTLKPGKTSGRFKVTSSIIITRNLGFNSMCRKKKHSLFH